MNNIVWIAGLYTGDGIEFSKWELMGVFDSEDKALECAKQDKSIFIGPIPMNFNVGVEPKKFHGLYYPAHETKPDFNPYEFNYDGL